MSHEEEYIERIIDSEAERRAEFLDERPSMTFQQLLPTMFLEALKLYFDTTGRGRVFSRASKYKLKYVLGGKIPKDLQNVKIFGSITFSAERKKILLDAISRGSGGVPYKRLGKLANLAITIGTMLETKVLIVTDFDDIANYLALQLSGYEQRVFVANLASIDLAQLKIIMLGARKRVSDNARVAWAQLFANEVLSSIRNVLNKDMRLYDFLS